MQMNEWYGCISFDYISSYKQGTNTNLLKTLILAIIWFHMTHHLFNVMKLIFTFACTLNNYLANYRL